MTSRGKTTWSKRSIETILTNEKYVGDVILYKTFSPMISLSSRDKFTQNEDLKQLLLATDDLVLEEGNTWHDTFWGVDAKTREGKNHLGRILIRVREELAEL